MRAERISLSKAIEREPLPQFYQRVRNGGARKPLRSLRELADEFGVPHKTLQAKLARCKGAPKPVYSTGDHKTASQRNTWYDPQEVRAWWRGLNQKEKDMRREICGECGSPISDDGSCICTEMLKRGWRQCAVGQKWSPRARG